MRGGGVVRGKPGMGLEKEGSAVPGKLVGNSNQIDDTAAGAACVAMPGEATW